MDCGPAALKCLLEGYGVHVSYGRLREACQTDVDGTSIDALLPADHLLVRETRALPALVVMRLPDGSAHFVVLWRRHGRYVQLMDPEIGRRWMKVTRFLEELYIHAMPVPASAWREWAASPRATATIRNRMRRLGIIGDGPLQRALEASDWRALAALDAGLRMVEHLVRSGALRKGRESARTLACCCARGELIPERYWSVRPGGGDEVMFRGAVLVSVRGVATAVIESAHRPCSRELAAALAEKPVRPGAELIRLLRADGVLAPGAIVLGLAAASAGVVAEAFLLRVFFDLPRELGLAGQRMTAIAALGALFVFLLFLELPLTGALLRYGRRLEVRLRQAFLEKIPRLPDRYFQSRLQSDMAQRSHTTHMIRHLPELGSQFVRGIFELALTAAAISWLDPSSAPLAVAVASISIALPMAAQPVIVERDLRLRTHAGALSRFYLDALLGLVPIRAHGAEGPVRREHGRLLREWARAGLDLQRVATMTEAAQLAAGYAGAAVLLIHNVARRGEPATALLLAYWSLNLPVIGQQIAMAAWQYPALRNVTLRLLEPLGALEESPHANAVEETDSATVHGPMEVVFENVTVVASGQKILDEISATIPAGGHVAIVGRSGAGKSSLVGLLLGWHRPAEGRILADGVPLDGNFDSVRRHTAWVDPAVQLWNRSLYENLRYSSADGLPRIADVIGAADLRSVLETLPEGLETRLGEGGALLSGGEGQRVRLARAMLREGVRLAILDEPFRGLDCEQRRELLGRARMLWHSSTLLCITHDIAGTQAFDRVLVIDGGRIVEDGSPLELAREPGSRFRSLLDAEAAAQQVLWSGNSWRRVRMHRGTVVAV